MALKTMRAGEFKARCLEMMDVVNATGETIILTKRGKPVAQLGPIVSKPKSLFGFLAGDVATVGDVTAPLGEIWDADRE